MNKRREIFETAKFIVSKNEKVSVNAVYLILASKNIKVSKTYIGQVLCWSDTQESLSRKIQIIGQRTKKEIIETKNQRFEFAKRREEMAKLTREGWTLQMIAEKYNITRQAVSLLLKKAASEGHIVVKSKKSNMKLEENVVLVKRKKKNIKLCEQCGKEFYPDNNRKNCSKKCFEKSIEKRSGGEWSRKEFVNLTCLTCGKQFKRTKYLHQITMKRKESGDNNYCSRFCYHNKNKSSAGLLFSGN
jgi:predicted DNA-binding protein YlxM (UPF0122 family)